MGNDVTTGREALLRAATLVRPALADKGYVRAFTHISLDGEWALACDERMAIAVRCDAEVRRLVPGALLVQALSTFGGREVLFRQDKDDSFVMKSGRSRVTLPTLPLSDMPFAWPADRARETVLGRDFALGLERCLVSVNSDGARPAQAGVTLDADADGRAVLFSTDNGSMSRYQCSTRVDLPGDAPAIMPREFCEQVLALSRAFPDCERVLAIGSGWLEVSFVPEGSGEPEAQLLARVAVDLEPEPFDRIMRRHAGEPTRAELQRRTVGIPEGLDGALGRALLVLSGETKKRAFLGVDRGTLRLRASSDFGDVDDSLDTEHADVPEVPADAALVSRALRYATRMRVTDSVTLLAGGEELEFLHVVAHVRDPR